MPDHTDLPSRRNFLKGAAAAFAATSLPLHSLQDPQNPKSLTKIFEGVQLQDQYGKDLNPVELFKDRNALVMFGYGGCQMCQKIGITVAAVQTEIDGRNKKIAEDNKKLSDDKKKPLIDLPIIVVSVLPAQDRFKDGKENPMKAYVDSYAENGVRQTKESGVSYERGKAVEQKDRVLHVVTTQDGKLENDYDMPQTIQSRLAKEFPRTNRFLPTDTKSHSPYITLFKNGIAVQTERAIPGMQQVNDNSSMETYAKACAKKLVDAALSQQTERSR